MNQLARNNLVRISRLASKLNFRTCSSQLASSIKSNPIIQPNSLSSKLPARNLSLTPVNFMQEKPKPGSASKSSEPVLIAELDDKKEDNLVKVRSS